MRTTLTCFFHLLTTLNDAQLHELIAQQRSQGIEELTSRYLREFSKVEKILDGFSDLAVLMVANINHFLANP